MADASGNDGVGGVGGVGGTSGTGSSNAASAAASAAASGVDVNDVAQSMVDAATGPAGVDVDALGTAVAGLQSQVTTEAAASLQAAVEAQLSPVDAAKLDAAVDAAALSGTTPGLAVSLTQSPVAGIEAPVGLRNEKGQAIDACGNVVAEASIDRSVPASETDYAKAVENLSRATAGPISGPVYSAAWGMGASQEHLDNVHAVGQVVDGFVALHADRAERGGF